MPTTEKRATYVQKNYVRQSNGSLALIGSTTNSVLHRSVTYPSTVSRKIPTDLFLAGTQRTTSSSYCSCSLYDYAVDGGRQVFTGVPAANLYPFPSGVNFPTLPQTDWDAMDNRARDEMRGDYVNLAVALGEYRQTAQLFVDAAEAVRTKGMSLAAALKRKKGVSKAFLTFQYGIKPLVGDMLDAIEALRAKASENVYVTCVKRKREFGMKRETLRINSTYHKYDSLREYHSIQRARGYYRARIDTSAVRNILTAHGFTNPFLLAWELVPFSFVIDWWINVGDVLASLDNCLKFDQLHVIRSVRSDRSFFAQSPGQGGPDFLTPHSCVRIERNDARSAPVQISLINHYRYKPSVSLEHILNGLALLHVTKGRFTSTNNRTYGR